MKLHSFFFLVALYISTLSLSIYSDAVLAKTPLEKTNSTHNSIRNVCKVDTLRAIQQYINNIKTFSADFIQLNPNKKQDKGIIRIAKPNKMRIEYLKQKHILLILKNNRLLHYDYELEEASYIPVNSQGLTLLAQENFRIASDIQLMDCKKENGNIKMIFRSKQKSNKTLESEDGDIVYFKFRSNPIALEEIGSMITKNHLLYITKLLTLNNVKLNTKLSKSTFVFRDPKFAE